MSEKSFSLISLSLLLLMMASCNQYQKILNNDDLNVKYKAAKDYYNNGEYLKDRV